VIELLGITIHEPDVVFTDLGLALLGGYFGWRLWIPGPGVLRRLGAILMAGLASAAFWGAIFHAFFPEESATRPGFVAWIPVALSIMVAAASMLELALRILVPALSSRSRMAIIAMYSGVFSAIVLLVDESFESIVRFYVPALLLFLIASIRQAIGRRGNGWGSISAGLLISVGAALLQQARVALHSDYFDHNAVYHVLQGIALAFLYFGFQAMPEGGGRAYAAGANPATRPG
jgi:hypothetical protein